MPTYVYECIFCKHQLEVYQSFHDEALRCCPKCKHNELARIIFPPILIDLTPKTVGGLADKNVKIVGNKMSDKRTRERELRKKQPPISKKASRRL